MNPANFKSGYRPFTGTFQCDEFKCGQVNLTKYASASSRHIIPEFTPISNQLSSSSCVGNAVIDLLEILKGLENPNKVKQLSRLFTYWNARNYIGQTGVDAGCYIPHAVDSIYKIGVCQESTWQFSMNNVLKQPTIESFKEASDNRINQFYSIKTTGSQRILDIEAAIKANHPVVFGVQVGSEFLGYNGSDKVFDPPTTSVGGHAMIITGVRTNDAGKREFYIRNSWGSNWGMSEPETASLGKGHAWFSEAYIDTIYAGDCFVATLMPDLLV